MLELGKPIHTFDAAAVDGRQRSSCATADAGETLETLDHVTRQLDAETLVIADARGPIGIAGVMGGAHVRGRRRARPRSIVESAIFDPVSVRRTAFRYALRSEASLRFEKGQEHRPGAHRRGPHRAADRRVGRRRDRRSASSTRTRSSRSRHDCRSARPRVAPARHRRAGGRAARAARARGGRHRDSGRVRRSIPVIDGEAPLHLARSEAVRRRWSRSCRPTGATCASRRTSPRRSPASAATRRSRGTAHLGDRRRTGRTRGSPSSSCGRCSPAAASTR